MNVRECQQFIASIRSLVCVGRADMPAHELVSLYLKEFAGQLGQEKYALFQITEHQRMECLSRHGIGDSVLSLLNADIGMKIPDLRHLQFVMYKAEEILLSRAYLLLGDEKTRLVFVAYNAVRRGKALSVLRRAEYRWYCEVFTACLVKALRMRVLEQEQGCDELSRFRGYKAFCMDSETELFDAYVMFRISDVSLLYESLSPKEFVEFFSLISTRMRGAVGRKEQVYHIGDSCFLLALNGDKWGVYQRVKLLLTVLNDLLCSKRPLSCPDMDVRAGLVYDYDKDGTAAQVISRLFGCVRKAEYASVYVHGQLKNSEKTESESVSIVLEEVSVSEEPERVTGAFGDSREKPVPEMVMEVALEESAVLESEVAEQMVSEEESENPGEEDGELGIYDIGRMFGINC